MKKFTLSSILALALLALSACAPSSQKGTSNEGDGIVGGTTVLPGSPLAEQVFMLLGRTDQGNYTCTATLITEQHVLTAAHCVQGAKWIVGVFKIDAIKAIRSGKTFNILNNPDVVPVAKAQIYPGYAGSSNGSISGTDAGDIAILKLGSPAPKGFKVTRISGTPLRKGTQLVVSGYGIASGTIPTGSGLLREARVKVDEPEVGQSEFSVDQRAGSGTCSGDSGGPSFLVSPFGDYQQVGVTSRGDKTCSAGGIYTYVPAFLPWINQVISRM